MSREGRPLVGVRLCRITVIIRGAAASPGEDHTQWISCLAPWLTLAHYLRCAGIGVWLSCLERDKVVRCGQMDKLTTSQSAALGQHGF
jgi:hypothetical protein